jgi:hypothetical protein
MTKKNKHKLQQKPEKNEEIECFYCHALGHSISECSLRLKRKGKKVCDYACRYCHEEDHFIADCPSIARKKEKESAKNKEDFNNSEENHANEMYIKFGPTWYIMVDETDNDCDIARKNRYDLYKIIEENNKELDDKIAKHFAAINSMNEEQEKLYQEFWQRQCDQEMDEYMKEYENRECILRKEYQENGWKWNEWSMIM